jgi:uncharacterized protein
MAILNVRVDDHVRDQLKETADQEGMTLSEYVRDLLLAAVVPVREERAHHGDETPPESLRLIDRQVLSLLHRILARVLPEGSNDLDGGLRDQLMLAMILEEGYAGEYWREVAGFSAELSKRDCGRVSDILQMFRILTFSITHLTEKGETVDDELARRLEFDGFDHNDPLEGHMASYVEHLITNGRWSELKPQVEANDNGNSHSPMLDTYSRMLAEYRRIMDSREHGFNRFDYLLSLQELEQIGAAQVHPSHRR